MKDSLKFGESLIANDKKLIINNNKASGRLIGEVLVEEYDKYGNNIFSETTYNDITLPGSIFVLEQMFKTISGGYRFPHTNIAPIGTYSSHGEGSIPTIKKGLDNNNKNDSYVNSQCIFGFMVGNGGETSTSIISPKYEASTLVDNTYKSSFLPLRIVSGHDNDPDDNGIKYYLKLTDNDGKKYFYAKGFTSDPTIKVVWADGSSNAVTQDNLNYNVPILTYAEIILDISEKDIREFFGNDSDKCYINQLGLVAGKPIIDENDNNRVDYEDVKLVTTLNFKSKDLSNDENKIKFTYKVYCL